MELPDWIGQVVVAGGGAAVLVGSLFIFLGKSWIKHQLAKDLESAKSEVSFHAAKRLKLHDKEHEVLPEIWARLSDVNARLRFALMRVKEMPDFSRMSDEDFKKWVESSDLKQDEKEMMIDSPSPDRMNCCNQILERRALRKAQESFLEFQAYLQKTRIFLSPEIKDRFDKIETLLEQAWSAKKTGVEVQHDGQAVGSVDLLWSMALNIFNYKVVPLMEELEKIIQGKLSPKREATKQ